LHSPSHTHVMDPFHGILIAAAILVLFLIFVAFPLSFLRYYFSTSVAEVPAPRGVGTELLGSLPVTVYRTEDHVGVLECAVCLAGLQDGEQARFLPCCGHGFHAGCISAWLASRPTCPLCRVTVVGKLPDALTSTSLPPTPQEPANYAGNLPASVLMLGVSDQATLGAVTVASDGEAAPPLQRQRCW
uniref:RING-type E3 ubiquitin transferase n=2 Tax=Aegilops tauschii TaxID=37682 RepID=A0A453DRN4_AEGTS